MSHTSYKQMLKLNAAYEVLKKEAAAGVYGKRVIPSTDDNDTLSSDGRPDFPYINDPEGFKTHVPLESEEVDDSEKELKEADEPNMPKPVDAGADAGADAGSADMETPEGGIGDMGMDSSGDMPGVEGGMNMPGMGEAEEKLTSNQIGRVYELKKIYSRLSSVESFLARTTDESILEIRKKVSQSIDLFELVISNFDQYKEQVDEIIITYYEFLDVVYDSIKTYFSGMSKE